MRRQLTAEGQTTHPGLKNPDARPSSFNHSPLPGRLPAGQAGQTGLEGESANRGRSPRIFRWGDRLFAFTRHDLQREPSGIRPPVGHPRAPKSGVRFLVPVLCSRLRRSAKARPAGAAPSTITSPCPSFLLKHALECFHRGQEYRSRAARRRLMRWGGLPTPHTPLTFSRPFHPEISRPFSIIFEPLQRRPHRRGCSDPCLSIHNWPNTKYQEHPHDS